MPERYRQVFGRESTRLHARIAQSRGDNLLHLESVPTVIEEESELCVVAVSFPGLIAAASAALAFEALDVIRADVYQRRTSLGEDETPAFFCLDRRGQAGCEPFDSEQLSRLKARMLELVRSQDFATRFQEASYSACTPDNSQENVLAYCSASGPRSLPFDAYQWSRISECNK